jgi:hypothetical protein
MQLSNEEEEDYNLSLSKFESMLKTNKVLFFDPNLKKLFFIILIWVRLVWQKSTQIGLGATPKSSGLKLVQVEMLVYDDKLELAEKLLNELYAIEPTNEEIYIQNKHLL